MSSISDIPLERRPSPRQPAERMRKRDALRGLFLPKGDPQREEAKNRLIPEGSKRARIVGLLRPSAAGSRPSTITEEDLTSFVEIPSPVQGPESDREVAERRLKDLEDEITRIQKELLPELEIRQSNAALDSDRILFLQGKTNELIALIKDSKSGKVQEINQKRHDLLLAAQSSLENLKIFLEPDSEVSDSPANSSPVTPTTSSPEIEKPMDSPSSDKGKEKDLISEGEESEPNIIIPSSPQRSESEILEEKQLEEAPPSPESLARIKELEGKIEKNQEILSGLNWLIDSKTGKIAQLKHKEEAITMKIADLPRTEPNSPSFKKYQTKVKDLAEQLVKIKKTLETYEKELIGHEEEKVRLEHLNDRLESQLAEAKNPKESMRAPSPVAMSSLPIAASSNEDQNVDISQYTVELPEEKEQAPRAPKQVRKDSLDEKATSEQLKNEIKTLFQEIQKVKKTKPSKESEKEAQADQIRALQDALMELLVQKQQIKAKQHLANSAPNQNGSNSEDIELIYKKVDLVKQELREPGLIPSEQAILESILSGLQQQIFTLTTESNRQYQAAESPSALETLVSYLPW